MNEVAENDNVVEMKQTKRDVQRVATLEEVKALLALPDSQRPSVMPRFVLIRGVIYDVSKKYDQAFIQKNLAPKSMKQEVKKRNSATVMPLCEKFERIKKVSRLNKKLKKAK